MREVTIFKMFCICLIFSTGFNVTANATRLKPGFDAIEYRELLLISARTTANPAYFKSYPPPVEFEMVYQSAPMGLDNLWDLWINKEKSIAVISIRGTTQEPVSFIANLYAAMLPAKGTLHFSGADDFHYNLADHPQAAVHSGWLLGMSYLSKDILPHLDSCYRSGVKDFLIVGHSQGGAISYLLTAYLCQLQDEGRLSDEVRFKTYCSAAPKPGNLYFAYDYENRVPDGWQFNVINTADWVPESPFSIQTVHDFNAINPFSDTKLLTRQQKFPVNLIMRYVINRLQHPPEKAQKNSRKYLGRLTAKLVVKNIPEFQPPHHYYASSNYVRTGQSVLLYADEAYYRYFPNDGKNIFSHHFHNSYLFLLDKKYFRD